MKNYLLLIVILCSSLLGVAQPNYVEVANANVTSSYVPFTGGFGWGTNQGWYSGNWSSQNAAKIAADLNVNTVRVPLYDDFLTQWGLQTELADCQYYTGTLGMKNLVAFIGSPNPNDQLDSVFVGTTEKAKVWKGMYEPVWLDAAKTQINPANAYASYLYKVIKMYGQYIRFYEIVNEPDFTYNEGGWTGDSDPPGANSWFYKNPNASDMVNVRANIFYYNRLLRLSYEVIKTLYPNSYVCTGGIGNRSFLDAVLRNTDNPADGSVSAQYPNTGGAYLDVISFHSYPEYMLKKWDNTLGKMVYFRNSDAAVNRGYLKVKNWMDSICQNYGYNGTKYPKKQFICTETGISRIMDGDAWGSEWGSVNYIIKALVASQKNGINQLYVYQLGDGSSANQFDHMGMYKWFGDSTPYHGLVKTKQGLGFQTTALLLNGKTYDATQTASLSLPATVDGGAFKASDGSYTYVLWAKTTLDTNETASASYTFQAASMSKKDWDYADTKKITVTGSTVTLTGTPSFFEGTTAVAPAPPPVQTPLPVSLISFTGTKISDNVELDWSANESNMIGYDIERSTDGTNFWRIGGVSAQNLSTVAKYTYIDFYSQRTVNYYRLKMLSKDGTSKYSNQVMVRFDPYQAQISVFDMSGRLIRVDNTTNVDQYKYNFKSLNLPKGIYILEIKSTNVEVQKIAN